MLRASLVSLASASIVAVIGCSSAEPDVAGAASNDYTETTPSDPAQKPATTFGADASVPPGDMTPAASGGDAAPPPDASIAPIPWSCTGSYGTTKASDGDYYITSFGCWVDPNNTIHTDPGDNCIPSCLAKAKQAGLCMPGDTGPECEERVNWFTADGARFGCLARLKMTNPANGKSVIAVALDYGPACTVERSVNEEVLDASGRVDLYLFGGDRGATDRATVHVVEVDPSTPLGPVP